MASVPAEHANLVGAPHFAHLVTVNRDGSPQSSPIWIRPARVADDGAVESIFFVTGLRYRKSLNMQREPRVALSIHGADQPYRMLEIVGMATLAPRPSWDELDALSNQYMGTDYPYKGADSAGWHVTVEIERVTLPTGGPRPESVDPPPADSDLLNPPHFAHVATVSSTGQPRSSVVWHRRPAEGGEHDIEFWTGAETLKTRHLRNNPAVAVSIHDEVNPYRYTELRGRAQITPLEGREMADELTRRYWKLDRFPMDELAGGVAIRVATTHRVG